MLTVGSLFAGIGGFDLGFERAGMRTLWQVEIDPFCRGILSRHFPDARRYKDVRDVGAAELAPVDLVCGGFPCQDLSVAGRGAGIEGERSGLWSEYARIVRELRPRYVVVENVAALLGRGLSTVVGDLAALGYDAEWDCLPASAFGAPHQRDRIWLVAYPHNGHGNGRSGDVQVGGRGVEGKTATDGLLPRHEWPAEPDVGRVAHGIPERLDRLNALGNALVPPIAEWIGRRIIESEEGGKAMTLPTEARARELEGRVHQLEAALRPFAGIADEADALGHLPGSTAMWRLAYNDLAPARAALKGEK